jgi:hypothetical protein
MAKRNRSRARRCRPCPPCSRRKRRGSPRFTAPCKARFRACMKETLKATGSMRTAGKRCMTDLQRCARGRSATQAVRKYKRMRSA